MSTPSTVHVFVSVTNTAPYITCTPAQLSPIKTHGAVVYTLDHASARDWQITGVGKGSGDALSQFTVASVKQPIPTGTTPLQLSPSAALTLVNACSSKGEMSFNIWCTSTRTGLVATTTTVDGDPIIPNDPD